MPNSGRNNKPSNSSNSPKVKHGASTLLKEHGANTSFKEQGGLKDLKLTHSQSSATVDVTKHTSSPTKIVSLKNSSSKFGDSFSNMETRDQSPSKPKQIKVIAGNKETGKTKMIKSSSINTKKYAPSNTSKKNMQSDSGTERSVRKTKTTNARAVAPIAKFNNNINNTSNLKAETAKREGNNTFHKNADDGNPRKPVKSSEYIFTIIRKSRTFKAMKSWYNIYLSAEEIIIRDYRIKHILDQLHLTQSQLRRLKDTFETIDVDRSGHVDILEVLDLIHTKKSPFVEVLFHNLIFNENLQRITLEDFICLFARYCTFSRDNILRFCFDTFDTDHSGTINESEFVELLQNINDSDPSYPGNFNKALEQFDADKDGFISYPEFIALEAKFPLILYPAFELQHNMQVHTLGEKGWLTANKHLARIRYIAVYRESHGGYSPPLSCYDHMDRMISSSCFAKIWNKRRIQLPDD